jgi:hypothetical protein
MPLRIGSDDSSALIGGAPLNAGEILLDFKN